ncbi:type II toxin-antitoxin system RelE/ParE family toxin [Duganella sp. HH105]|uniref:type II toxin-antitoxin system RelE family toxin n=1 Tax=Duganella sp. HH105 TaxID=1781067 RepID=UPI000877B981|nr:type II toxin-antitoxin system RelE/ParE family toxin [Duganella sp. HH105]OEZ62510.1 mRNA interferase RelE [Duganella sp. HH105]
MTYRLEFNEQALKEWKKLDHSIREQFKKLLARRLVEPHVPSARLSGAGMQNTYKIKLRDAGYRLVYEVHDEVVTVIVLSVSKRDKNKAYNLAQLRKLK